MRKSPGSGTGLSLIASSKLIIPVFLCFLFLSSFQLKAQEYKQSAKNKVASGKYVLTYKPVNNNSSGGNDLQLNGGQTINAFDIYPEVERATYDAATGLVTVIASDASDLPEKININTGNLGEPENNNKQNNTSQDEN